MTLFSDRIPPQSVDYDTSRFVVSTIAGLNVDGQKLEMGDEVPHGVLSAYALQCEYQRPPGRIELLRYALTVPDLREACARRGVDVTGVLADSDSNPAPDKVDGEEHDVRIEHEVEPVPDLEKLNKEELKSLCERSGLSTNGSEKSLRRRLAALLD